MCSSDLYLSTSLPPPPIYLPPSPTSLHPHRDSGSPPFSRQKGPAPLAPPLSALSIKEEYAEAAMLADKFAEGQDVLARWSDGLFYLGTVTKVTEPEH